MVGATSSLAAILVYTGFKLVNLNVVRELRKFGISEVLIYFATVLTIVAADLLTGVILGNSQLQAMRDISRVSDGLAWLAQIMMFLLLGLLVTPSQFLPVALPALLVALALMLAARPIAVWVSVLPFRVPWREQLFMSWVGLRGGSATSSRWTEAPPAALACVSGANSCVSASAGPAVQSRLRKSLTTCRTCRLAG